MERKPIEEIEKEKHEALGHGVYYYMEYDAYLCLDCKENLTRKLLGKCDDENCEYCKVEIDWENLGKFDWVEEEE